MSRSLNSPTGRLLRSSRLFSLPPPLPAYPMDIPVGDGVKRSDAVTHPYPTYQAITTPPSSHARGDWGLKRPLPTKTTSKTSTPHLRIKAIDNRAHVTDFESAAGHTRSLAKWQEMNIVMRRREALADIYAGGQTSVFDDSVDNTVHKDTQPQKVGPRSTPARWKVRGPWLASMSEYEFQQYLDKNLRSAEQRAGFLDYVAKVYSAQKRSEALARMRENGELGLQEVQVSSETEDAATQHTSRVAAELDQAAVVTQSEFDEHIRFLRHNHDSVNSDLGKLIQDYFDLPAVSREYSGFSALVRATSRQTTSDAPPPTHPSAGISYLRTDAWMENHPKYGPQTQHPVVEARVLRPRQMGVLTMERAQLGVGGFVVNDARGNGPRGNYDPDTPNGLVFRNNYDKVGGNKIWVHPLNGHVNAKGLVRLEVNRGTKEAIGVKTGIIDPRRPTRNGKRFLPGPLLSMNGGPELGNSTRRQGFGDNEVRRIRDSMKNQDKDEGLAQFKTLFKEFNSKGPSRPAQ